ncbi:protein-disulfide isomerase [Nakamurella sp. UYEF19]|uniref:DsbA family protein n=1 Tax=Nakamurella sp. UYEF19 TaxID=1756392 RepID=UPI003398D650
MYIGIVAVTLIAVVVIIGLVLNKKANASPVTDHPTSVNSTSSAAGGIVTVNGGGGSPPALVLDLYEDGLCPACQAFEAQYGQQIMKAVDEGKLTVHYHFLNFLNKASSSGDYSTRAAAALQCVAATPAAASTGLFLNFHKTMFTSGIQPAENGSADLSNVQIADIATKAGAPASAATCIKSGANIEQAKTTAEAGLASLTKATPAGQAVATPAVVRDGALLNLNTTDWLTNLLA